MSRCAGRQGGEACAPLLLRISVVRALCWKSVLADFEPAQCLDHGRPQKSFRKLPQGGLSRCWIKFEFARGASADLRGADGLDCVVAQRHLQVASVSEGPVCRGWREVVEDLVGHIFGPTRTTFLPVRPAAECPGPLGPASIMPNYYPFGSRRRRELKSPSPIFIG